MGLLKQPAHDGNQNTSKIRSPYCIDGENLQRKVELDVIFFLVGSRHKIR